MLRRIPFLVLVLALLAPPGGAPVAAHGRDDRLDEIHAEIHQKRRAIRAAESRKSGALASIRASDSRRESLTGQIADLAAALAAARARLLDVRADLGTARRELGRSNKELALAEGQLFLQQQTLGERAANTYKLGPGGYLNVVLGSETLRDLADRIEFTEDVLVADSDLLTGIEVTKELVSDHQQDISTYKLSLDERRERVRRELRKVERMKARREALRAQTEREIVIHRELVGDIESTKKRYEQAVAQLEQESANIRAAIQGNGSSGSGRVGAMAWPTAGPVTSGFGWRTHPIYGTRRFHAGIDIDGDCGQTIVAAAKGTVISAGWRGGYGNATIIDHGNGVSTLYGHQSSIGVGVGQRVSRGAAIGNVGTTGFSTGCHLHFEVRINGEPVNPMSYL